MAKVKNAPSGAVVTGEELKDEAAEKRIAAGSSKEKSFDDFLATMRDVERQSLKPTSSELETITTQDDKEVMALQFESKRLVGYKKVGKTHVCLVKTLAFMKKKEDLEKSK